MLLLNLILVLLLSAIFEGKEDRCKQQIPRSRAVCRTVRYVWTGSHCAAICSNKRGSSFTSESECRLACASRPIQRLLRRRLARQTAPADAGVCHLPLANLRSGCMPQFPIQEHFYFNNDLQECKEFHFFDCQGNGNDFPTREACESLCLPQTTSEPTAITSIAGQSTTVDSTTHSLGSPTPLYPQPSTTDSAADSMSSTTLDQSTHESMRHTTTDSMQGLTSDPSTVESTIHSMISTKGLTSDPSTVESTKESTRHSMISTTSMQGHPSTKSTPKPSSTSVYDAAIIAVAILVVLVLVLLVLVMVAITVLWWRSKNRLTVITKEEREEPVVLAYFPVTKEVTSTEDPSHNTSTKLSSISVT